MTLTKNYRVNVEGGSKITLVPAVSDTGSHAPYSVTDGADRIYYSPPKVNKVKEAMNPSANTNQNNSHFTANVRPEIIDENVEAVVVNTEQSGNLNDSNNNRSKYESANNTTFLENSWKKSNNNKTSKRSKNPSKFCSKTARMCCVGGTLSSSEYSSDCTDYEGGFSQERHTPSATNDRKSSVNGTRLATEFTFLQIPAVPMKRVQQKNEIDDEVPPPLPARLYEDADVTDGMDEPSEQEEKILTEQIDFNKSCQLFGGQTLRRRSRNVKKEEHVLTKVTIEKVELKQTPNGDAQKVIANGVNGYAPVETVTSQDEYENAIEDGPTKNVKEIRAMFNKNYDYESYAKPKAFSKSPASTSPKNTENRFNFSNTQEQPQIPTPVVQQQIRGLFKGVFEVEGKPAPPVPPPRKTAPDAKPQPEINNNEPPEPRLSVAQKVAAFNTAKPPIESRVPVDPNKSPVIETPQPQATEEKEKQVALPLPTPPPVPAKPVGRTVVVPEPQIVQKTEDVVQIAPKATISLQTRSIPDQSEDIKQVLAKVQEEKMNLETFDDSLDQFYNVLEELSL